MAGYATASAFEITETIFAAPPRTTISQVGFDRMLNSRPPSGIENVLESLEGHAGGENGSDLVTKS